MNHRGKHGGDIAVGGLEDLRHPLHQRFRRIFRNEVSRDLLAQMRGGRGMVNQDIYGFIDFGEPAALDGMS